ncbi:MAG: beta-N-acetylglucosaminidase domain-containing protein [Pseudomonadales bacterium]|nr:beta-N-acetylglucosaminidase domain-containing protein [Pseudomonadales bacterium]
MISRILETMGHGRASKQDFQSSDMTLGIIEGFFGHSWSWQARFDFADFLFEQGFDSYLYAPKADSCFRKQWFSACPASQLAKLQDLAAHYRHHHIDFGMGLSPVELYRNFDHAQQQVLERKIQEINHIGARTLCILFDDMRGDFPGLARQQAAIVQFAADHSQADRLLICPTYYSSDPLLSRVFGDMPDHYLEDLGRLLDPAVEIFWTGPRVFSHDFPALHMQEVTEKLRRKPLIWDNYPVNDSQRLSPFLHLRPFAEEKKSLLHDASGHFVNPMNQAWLSRIALYSLPRLHHQAHYDAEAVLRSACYTLCGRKLGQSLLDDLEVFQDQGLERLDAEARLALKEKYRSFGDNPYVREIMAWLDNYYVFDPACLT